MNTQRKTLILIIIIFITVTVGLFFAYQSFITEKITNGFKEVTDGNGRSTLFPGLGLFDREGDEVSDERDGFVPKLRQISSAPTSGGIVFNTEEKTVIRYVERASGHVFETTSDSLEQNRISNTTIPRIQESVWSPDGEAVILRYLDENEILKSFYGKVSKDVGVLDGWFLSNNIRSLAVHEDGDILYMQKVGNDAKGIISNFDGTDSKTVLSSRIHDWTLMWIGDSVGTVTKASSALDGFLYELHSGVKTKLLSVDGLLTKINTDGTKILFSTSNTSGTRLLVLDSETKEITEVPFTTLAEKCVWASSSTFFCASPYNRISGTVPDDWYKGLLSFYDDIWVYDIETEEAKLVYDAAAEGKTLDIINLTIDSENKILLFTNKIDLTLWALSL